MFGIFIQGKHGLVWVGNEPTLEEAQTVVESDLLGPESAHREQDFILILPISKLYDLDGN